MSKTIAELRADPPKSRAETALTVCVAPHLVAEVQALTEELTEILTRQIDDEGEPVGPPKRILQERDTKAKELRKRLAAVLDEMAEHEGELRLRANPTDGEWRNWANAHPPREKGKPGFARDVEVAGYRTKEGLEFAFCNADDLIDDLVKYAHKWNGDPLAEGDWAVLAESLGMPDLKKAAAAVVGMYESSRDFRSWRSGLSATLLRLNASASPAASKSPRAGSMAGSPSRSSAATTKKAAKSP